MFAFDLFFPIYGALMNPEDNNVERLGIEWTDTEGRTVRRCHVRERVHMLNQVI